MLTKHDLPPVEAIRALVHLETEALMHDLRENDSYTYNTIKSKIFENQEAIRSYCALLNIKKLPTLREDMILNDIVSRAIEAMFMIDTNIVLDENISHEEKEKERHFYNAVAPIIKSSDHRFFNDILFVPHNKAKKQKTDAAEERKTRIKRALVEAMTPYQLSVPKRSVVQNQYAPVTNITTYPEEHSRIIEVHLDASNEAVKEKLNSLFGERHKPGTYMVLVHNGYSEALIHLSKSGKDAKVLVVDEAAFGPLALWQQRRSHTNPRPTLNFIDQTASSFIGFSEMVAIDNSEKTLKGVNILYSNDPNAVATIKKFKFETGPYAALKGTNPDYNFQPGDTTEQKRYKSIALAMDSFNANQCDESVLLELVNHKELLNPGSRLTANMTTEFLDKDINNFSTFLKMAEILFSKENGLVKQVLNRIESNLIRQNISFAFPENTLLMVDTERYKAVHLIDMFNGQRAFVFNFAVFADNPTLLTDPDLLEYEIMISIANHIFAAPFPYKTDEATKLLSEGFPSHPFFEGIKFSIEPESPDAIAETKGALDAAVLWITHLAMPEESYKKAINRILDHTLSDDKNIIPSFSVAAYLALNDVTGLISKKNSTKLKSRIRDDMDARMFSARLATYIKNIKIRGDMPEQALNTKTELYVSTAKHDKTSYSSDKQYAVIPLDTTDTATRKKLDSTLFDDYKIPDGDYYVLLNGSQVEGLSHVLKKEDRISVFGSHHEIVKNGWFLPWKNMIIKMKSKSKNDYDPSVIHIAYEIDDVAITSIEPKFESGKLRGVTIKTGHSPTSRSNEATNSTMETFLDDLTNEHIEQMGVLGILTTFKMAFLDPNVVFVHEARTSDKTLESNYPGFKTYLTSEHLPAPLNERLKVILRGAKDYQDKINLLLKQINTKLQQYELDLNVDNILFSFDMAFNPLAFLGNFTERTPEYSGNSFVSINLGSPLAYQDPALLEYDLLINLSDWLLANNGGFIKDHPVFKNVFVDFAKYREPPRESKQHFMGLFSHWIVSKLASSHKVIKTGFLYKLSLLARIIDDPAEMDRNSTALVTYAVIADLIGITNNETVKKINDFINSDNDRKDLFNEYKAYIDNIEFKISKDTTPGDFDLNEFFDNPPSVRIFFRDIMPLLVEKTGITAAMTAFAKAYLSPNTCFSHDLTANNGLAVEEAYPGLKDYLSTAPTSSAGLQLILYSMKELQDQANMKIKKIAMILKKQHEIEINFDHMVLTYDLFDGQAIRIGERGATSTQAPGATYISINLAHFMNAVAKEDYSVFEYTLAGAVGEYILNSSGGFIKDHPYFEDIFFELNENNKHSDDQRKALTSIFSRWFIKKLYPPELPGNNQVLLNGFSNDSKSASFILKMPSAMIQKHLYSLMVYLGIIDILDLSLKREKFLEIRNLVSMDPSAVEFLDKALDFFKGIDFKVSNIPDVLTDEEKTALEEPYEDILSDTIAKTREYFRSLDDLPAEYLWIQETVNGGAGIALRKYLEGDKNAPEEFLNTIMSLYSISTEVLNADGFSGLIDGLQFKYDTQRSAPVTFVHPVPGEETDKKSYMVINIASFLEFSTYQNDDYLKLYITHAIALHSIEMCLKNVSDSRTIQEKLQDGITDHPIFRNLKFDLRFYPQGILPAVIDEALDAMALWYTYKTLPEVIFKNGFDLFLTNLLSVASPRISFSLQKLIALGNTTDLIDRDSLAKLYAITAGTDVGSQAILDRLAIDIEDDLFPSLEFKTTTKGNPAEALRDIFQNIGFRNFSTAELIKLRKHDAKRTAVNVERKTLLDLGILVRIERGVYRLSVPLRGEQTKKPRTILKRFIISSSRSAKMKSPYMITGSRKKKFPR